MADERNQGGNDDLLDSAIPIEMVDDDGKDEVEAIELEPEDDEDESADDAAGRGTEAQDPYGAPPPGASKKSKIRMLTERKPHDDRWDRTPNLTGKGAIHVKTFVTKLRLDAVEHLDEQVNEWLDAHPEYEVKFVTTTIGKLVGKNTEDALFMNVWV